MHTSATEETDVPNKKFRNTFIVSLGGSLVVPDEINVSYLKKFHSFVLNRIKKGDRLILVIGGGKTARKYRDAGAAVIKKMPADDLDWIGIHATRLNAHLLLVIFRSVAHFRIITDPGEPEVTDAKVIIAGGHRPGHSTDFVAVELAKHYGAKRLFNLSNIDYVYTKDPKLTGAKKIEKTSWKEFRKIVGNKWIPGSNTPFDPIASRLAQRYGLEVTVMNGKNLKNLAGAMDGKKFKGTIISDGK